MAEDRAAFGIYPSSGRRPERLNQSRDVNAPLQLLRGWTAGLLGLPGDVEGLVRMLPGIQNETPVLPTSDFYREYLPGYDPRPAATALSGLGALTGGAGATRVAREGLGAVKRATDVNAIRNYIRSAQGVSGMPGTAVIKPKGGNWLTGDIEKQTETLKSRGPTEEDRNWILQRAENQRELGQDPNPVLQGLEAIPRTEAINKWIEAKLNKYIRNEMGTPEDPVRALAERDVLHFEPQQVFGDAPSTLMRKRAGVGMPTPLFGKSEMARRWETLADRAIDPFPAGAYKYGSLDENFLASNPWLEKVPDEALVYKAKGLRRDMGFDHLIDELKNATRADSDLPRELRLRPEQLSKVTMPQAVELVDRINKWRAAQTAEANLAKARNPATFTVKEYPDQKMQWVELRSPEFKAEDALADMTESERSWFQRYLDKGDSPQEAFKGAVGNRLPMPGQKALEDALKYEGEVMGHCVGGYCPAVAEGRSKIYSLRDAKGEPHVTIEVRPNTVGWTSEEIVEKYGQEEFLQIYKDIKDRVVGDKIRNYTPEEQDKFKQLWSQITQEKYGTAPAEIVQIKGKGNRAPKEDYLPMVQDFVKSQRWSQVGDLSYTGLMPFSQVSDLATRIKAAGKEPPQFITRQEELELLKQYYPDEGYARGGLVSAYDPDRIAEMAAQLEEEMYA